MEGKAWIQKVAGGNSVTQKKENLQNTQTTPKRLDKRSCISSFHPYSSLYFFDYLWHHFNPTAAF